jgi:hypothetical protein
VAGLSVLAASRADGQRTSYHNFNSWYILGADVALTDKWNAGLDLQERRSGPLRQPQAFFFRPALNYSMSPAVKLGFGISRSESYPFGEIPTAYQAPEWRVFEQVQLAQSVDRLGITHRYRVEQRWQGKRGVDTSDHRIASWLQSGRFRYQIKGLLPAHGQTVNVGDGYLTAGDEVFISYGRNVANNVFDQNRASIGAGLRYTAHWRAEVGFLQQTSLKSNGKDLEQNATLTFALYYSRERKHESP